MSNVLVVAEHVHGKFPKTTLVAVAAGKALATKAGGKCVAAVLGQGIDALAGELADYGVDVLAVDSPALAHYLADAYAAAGADLVKQKGFEAVVLAATSIGKDLAPRLAARLDAGFAPDITAIVDAKTFQRPIWAGNVIQTLEIAGTPRVISVRGTAFPPGEATGGAAAIETVAPTGSVGLSEFVRAELSKSERPELTSARVIISGGRGMQSGDNFHLLEKVADKLGAAVGASRAAVDAGFVPNDYQVGQTGKIVAPELYVAVGISGAIQHLAGMKDSKVIVAINKDEEAPIFQVADYGLVGDLFKILPELEAELERRQ